jgi:hypothetical protein
MSVAMGQESHEAASTSASAPRDWEARDHVRAFYSGHSLSEGVPEVVEQIARSVGHRLDFEVQVLGYSLLRQRTKGEMPSASEWPGYRAGQNRRGAGLDVAEELRQPQRLPPGEAPVGGPGDPITIGKPIANTTVYVVDRSATAGHRRNR